MSAILRQLHVLFARAATASPRCQAARMAAALAVAVALVGCGPIQATSAIGEAKSAVEEAHKAHAEELAPYPWHRADAFLTLAKIKEGFSEFDAAIKYAHIARDAAKKALEQARRREYLERMRARQPGTAPRTTPPAAPVAPGTPAIPPSQGAPR